MIANERRAAAGCPGDARRPAFGRLAVASVVIAVVAGASFGYARAAGPRLASSPGFQHASPRRLAPRPAPRIAQSPGRLIDAYLPTAHLREFHTERIHASPGRVFAAVHAVSPSEVRGLVPLMWMNAPSFDLSGRSQAQMRRPLLEVMARDNFVVLGEWPADELVVGTIGQFWGHRSVRFRDGGQFRSFRDPRYAKVAMNVHVRNDGDGWSSVTTETRVAVADPEARRKFDDYWRWIQPTGTLIRAQWIDAVRRRAERP